MKKIGFVIPWHGQSIPGGAEMALREVTEHLHAAGMDIEILSTCVREFTADWSENYYQPGLTVENGIPVRRFKADKCNAAKFNQVNIKLMADEHLTREEEKIFINEIVNSREMYKYIAAHQGEYALFVYIPYMFGPTYFGARACLEKAVLIPCFHEEAYIYMDIFKETFSKVRGMIFNAQPEKEIAERVYDLRKVETIVPGLGMNTSLTYDADRFRAKFDIQEPFILYAGRKDVGKNIYTLIRYFEAYKKRNRGSNLKLVLIGGGQVNIPRSVIHDVKDLGFVDQQDKYDACGAALCLCQPSKHESFSYVIMESWLCGRPVLVHKACDVTRNFAVSFNGGFYFDNYFEFEGQVDYLLTHPEEAAQLGANGRQCVIDNFTWDVVVGKYRAFFEKLTGEQ